MTSFEFFLESQHNYFEEGHTGNMIQVGPLKVPEQMLRNGLLRN